MEKKCEKCKGNMRQMRLSFTYIIKPDRNFWKCYSCGSEEEIYENGKTTKKIIKIQPTRESAEELADMGIKLGLEKPKDRDKLIEIYMQPMEALFG